MLDSRNPSTDVIPNTTSIAGALNKAELIGNLTKDPEVRQTPSGATVVSIAVATNYSWKDKNGETQDKTEFHNVVIWNELAEEIGKYFKKGRKVYIAGRLQTRKWETPTGQKRYSTEIIADKALALGLPALDLESNQSTAPVAVKTTPKKESGTVTDDMIPEIKYESDVKPEDLPF